MNLNWYPGHMVKALRRLEKDLPMVDAVIELADARIPQSSRNPDLRSLRGDKPALLVYNRSDLAEAKVTACWQRQALHSLALDATKPGAVRQIYPAMRSLLSEKLARRVEKGQGSRPLHLMVVGIPNIGKSTLINNLLGKKAARAEDRPGVTRGTQWFALENGWMLLDTPGLLWPKVEDEQAALHLAFTGAMPDDIMDMETLAAHLACELGRRCPDALTARYKTEPDFSEEGFAWLEKAALKRAYLVSRGEADIARMAQTLLDEFRAGKIAKVSFETPRACL